MMPVSEADRVKLQLLNVKAQKTATFWFAFNFEYMGCLPLDDPRTFWKADSEEEIIKLVLDKVKTRSKGITR